MGLEDIAQFGSIPESIIMHPSDAVSMTKIIPLLAAHAGISYLRTLRSKTPVIYDDNETFVIGGSKILRQSSEDALTIVAAGITVHEALKAYDFLREEGILVRVIDCYSIKPIDSKTLKESLRVTRKNIILSVEDHYYHGGLGDFVRDAVFSEGIVEKLAVRKFSRSGKPEELLKDAGIDARHIASLVKNLLSDLA
jgi:transketolase